ncbi:hypothetical protein F2P81_017258 [Scophthalmus maximus]|uniref:Uncharacterized protein n=1 Tax=Scophthalmus maximus TaxID=52904 RepID=A0A6A4SBI1_SCOMX|nr:hypothetical protein F2P81_017258 [Scophthalmus maximus]
MANNAASRYECTHMSTPLKLTVNSPPRCKRVSHTKDFPLFVNSLCHRGRYLSRRNIRANKSFVGCLSNYLSGKSQKKGATETSRIRTSQRYWQH